MNFSDNSTNGNEKKKKQHEGSLNDSQNVDNIFPEGLSSPDCVAILVNCIKNMEKQSVEIFDKTEETKNSQIKGEQHLMELHKSVTLISEKSDGYEREKIERENYERLQKETKDMSSTIQSFRVSLDRQEQYSRRNCLLIYGLPEKMITPIKLLLRL